jgi:hypothetical protein
MERKAWSAEQLGSLVRGYQGACVVMAAAELDLFALLAAGPCSAAQAAEALDADLRGMRTLLDALAALGLVEKVGLHYRALPEAASLMTAQGPGSQLAMVQHQANCLRSWAQLAGVVKRGTPAERTPSIRGSAGDYAAFIEAMDNIARATAGPLAESLRPEFTHLLDVGGASGSYTIAFLRSRPGATATLFDLPQVMPQAEARLLAAGVRERVTLVAGNFYDDPLPAGADLAWVSAIVHQNSRAQNQALFRRVHAALVPGGRIWIRDFVMEEARTEPVAGALFAINMLVNTPCGGTYTRQELTDDLAAAGFSQARLLRHEPTMSSVLAAGK